MIKILFICHGNICRSTMAQSIFTHMVSQAGRENEFHIESAATSREEIGNGPHYGTVNKLRSEGISIVPHRAVQMTRADYEHYDLLIGMDDANIRNMTRISGGDPDGKFYKLLDFADAAKGDRIEGVSRCRSRDVADPWYTDDFDATYRDVMAGCRGLLNICL